MPILATIVGLVIVSSVFAPIYSHFTGFGQSSLPINTRKVNREKCLDANCKKTSGFRYFNPGTGGRTGGPSGGK